MKFTKGLGNKNIINAIVYNIFAREKYQKLLQKYMIS